METLNREKVIIKTSIIGIVVNLILVVFKLAIGILSNSIAIILDGVNNLADALSSVITIIGAKLSGKKPTKEHPMGYGRIEYLSSMIVSAIVIYAGVTSFVESVKKIITPEEVSYSTVSIVIIAVAIVAKLALGLYVKKKGVEIGSGALEASGTEAKFDAILSLSVLASIVIYYFTSFSIEAFVGAVISIIIFKSGLELLLETIDDLLGRRADAELSKHIKALCKEVPGVLGAYDLFFNDYGPDKQNASIHIELPDTMTIAQADVIIRQVQDHVLKETGVLLVAVGLYSQNSINPTITAMKDQLQQIINKYDWALSTHGFYVDEVKKEMRFDAVIDFKMDANEALATLTADLKHVFPDYKASIVADIDISD